MTSPVDASVKFFSSAMPGAPVLNGIASSGVSLFDACLVNGFGSLTLTSLTVSGGIATAAYSGTFPALPESVVLIGGVTGSLTALNGEQKVTAIGTGNFQFATAAANGTAAGTITAKMAPLGFSVAFTGTNLRAYRSNDVASNRFYLRVNDTGTTDMRVVGYEAMTAISTGTNLFPTNAQQSGGGYWPKTLVAGAGEVASWMLFGNSKRFYYCVAAGECVSYSAGAYDAMAIMGFGDFPSWKSTVDAYNCMLLSQPSAINMSYSFSATRLDPGASPFVIVRLHTNAVGARFASLMPTNFGDGTDSGNSGGAMGPANTVVNTLILSNPIVGIDIATYGPRGNLPELFHTSQQIPVAFNILKGDLVPGTGAALGRKLMVVPGAQGPSSSSNGTHRRATFFDITGPWA